jgi:hypothetical protein
MKRLLVLAATVLALAACQPDPPAWQTTDPRLGRVCTQPPAPLTMSEADSGACMAYVTCLMGGLVTVTTLGRGLIWYGPQVQTVHPNDPRCAPKVKP